MKFNIRAIDTDHSNQTSVFRTRAHSLSSSRSYTYLKEQGIQGFSNGNIVGGYVGPGMCRGRLENIQREIEKDKIRQEIIAEEMEMERRRVLEEEVRNEMMMERQMGLRSSGTQFKPLTLPLSNTNLFETRVLHQKPSGFEERIAASLEEKYSRGSQIVPVPEFGDSSKVNVFSTPLPLISKKEVIVLGKPNGETTMSGTKRKSTPAVSDGSNECCGDVSKKKQVTVEWSCAVCQVSATSERGLNEHVEGKKHKVKEAAFIASKTGANFGLGVAAKKPTVKPFKLSLTTINLSCSDTKKSKTRKKTPEMGKTSNPPDSNKYKFWCEICRVGAFSEKVMNNHRDGKKHLKTLGELSQKAKLESETPEVEMTNDTEEKTEAETNETVVLEIVASEEKTETETKEDVVIEMVAEEKSKTETNKTIVVEVIKTVKDDQQDVTETLDKENVTAEGADTITDDGNRC